ncbi:MAG: 50S ribosomal protein L19 [Candidatus Magasanikbacteria bacterium]|nr:50S ribosomal protein L19 [Candidatus Magasanikbacteria bacterium]
MTEQTPAVQFKPGMVVKVHQKIKELNTKGEEKERIQIFEGTILAMRHGSEAGATMTVHKISDGVGVERIFPLRSPAVAKFEVVKQYTVRRARLDYLKGDFKRKLKEKKTQL